MAHLVEVHIKYVRYLITFTNTTQEKESLGRFSNIFFEYAVELNKIVESNRQKEGKALNYCWQ